MSAANVHITWGPTVEVKRWPAGVRWCFGCRAHLPHDDVLYDYAEPTYYEPVLVRKCSRCNHDRTEFPRG